MGGWGEKGEGKEGGPEKGESSTGRRQRVPLAEQAVALLIPVEGRAARQSQRVAHVDNIAGLAGTGEVLDLVY